MYTSMYTSKHVHEQTCTMHVCSNTYICSESVLKSLALAHMLNASVASLNNAGEKLGTPSNNAADIQQDLDNLNCKWVNQTECYTKYCSVVLLDNLKLQ